MFGDNHFLGMGHAKMNDINEWMDLSERRAQRIIELATELNKARDEVEAMRTALTYIRDTSDDWHVCEKAADALADAAMSKEKASD